MRSAIACALLLVLGAAAQAADWVWVAGSRGANANSVYLDRATILPSGDYIKAWSKMVHERPQTTKKGVFRVSMTLDVYDCVGHRSALRQAEMFEDYALTHLVRSGDWSARDEFMEVVPGSIQEATMAAACDIYLRSRRPAN